MSANKQFVFDAFKFRRIILSVRDIYFGVWDMFNCWDQWKDLIFVGLRFSNFIFNSLFHLVSRKAMTWFFWWTHLWLYFSSLLCDGIIFVCNKHICQMFVVAWLFELPFFLWGFLAFRHQRLFRSMILHRSNT